MSKIKKFFAMIVCGISAITLFPNVNKNIDVSKQQDLFGAAWELVGNAWNMTGETMQKTFDEFKEEYGKK